MEVKKRSRLKMVGLVGIGALALAAFSQMMQQSSIMRLQQEPLDLQVDAIQQSESTSCGEAVIAMAYNYAHPQTPINEREVIEYATTQGYFTAGVPPFTSPANMVKIARHYADKVSTGTVLSSRQGLLLLVQRLRADEPVIIDVLSNFSDPDSEAHFILVIGVSTDPNRENVIVIHYNDPLTGTQESADWAGNEGVWNAWQNNGDPGGPGWWMVITSP
jgi:Papain-like cysteine protease AvrRpt2